MSFKVGDRVRSVEQGHRATVVEEEREGTVRVRWDLNNREVSTPSVFLALIESSAETPKSWYFVVRSEQPPTKDDIDATDLLIAVNDLSIAFDRDRCYSVPVMQAVGDLVKASKGVIDFNEEDQ